MEINFRCIKVGTKKLRDLVVNDIRYIETIIFVQIQRCKMSFESPLMKILNNTKRKIILFNEIKFCLHGKKSLKREHYINPIRVFSTEQFWHLCSFLL